MSIIKLENVWRSYEMGELQVDALRGISFEVEQGEFLSIMGPSGSGKSTCMNMIGCLDRPTKGDVIINGKKTAEMSETELAHVCFGASGLKRARKTPAFGVVGRTKTTHGNSPCVSLCAAYYFSRRTYRSFGFAYRKSSDGIVPRNKRTGYNCYYRYPRQHYRTQRRPLHSYFRRKDCNKQLKTLNPVIVAVRRHGKNSSCHYDRKWK